jgi:hypothetical protein
MFDRNEGQWFRGIPWFLPILIDTPRYLAFIELDFPFFVLHRLQQLPGLLLTHLTFFLRRSFHSFRILWRFLRLLVSSRFYFSGFLFAGR